MLRKFPYYPLLFSIFPVLSIAAHNIHEISPGVIYRPLVASFLFGSTVFVLLWLLFRDWTKAALTALIVLSLFFAYGHIYDTLEDLTFYNVSVFRHRTLLPLFGLLLVIGLFWFTRKVKQPARFTFWLNLLSIYLLIYPLFTIVWSIIQQFESDRRVLTLSSRETTDAHQPDIYYIILDGYGRGDVLLNNLGFDNSEFLASLAARGFYVADCSQSNYAYTQFSLPSSLSYDYLENLGATDRGFRVALLRHGAVRTFLEAKGYKVVAFPTGWNYTEWSDADLYLDYAPPATSLTEFEDLVLNTTLVRAAWDLKLINQDNASSKDLRRLRALSVLDHLKKLPLLDDNLFVFAHIIVPHPPYSFGPNGEWVEFEEKGATYEETRAAYIDQVKFINQSMLEVVDIILKESKTSPVIIIQGDHGPPPELSLTHSEKMPILNAYYLPGVQMEDVLYPSISPVNSFRVVLNSYFGQNLPLLEDHSYYASNENHDGYELVPNSCQENP